MTTEEEAARLASEYKAEGNFESANFYENVADGQRPFISAEYIDWLEFWDRAVEEREYMFRDVLIANRYTVIYSQPGQGKSLLGLWIAIDAASREKRVLYVDNEMGEDDLHERLRDFTNVSGPLDLFNVRYAQHQFNDITNGNATRLVSDVIAMDIDLVIIDTWAASVIGNENAVETIQLFDALVAAPLKARGVTLLLLDHEGKDSERGQRGSSAKNGLADVVWRLKQRPIVGADDFHIELDRKKTRINNIMEKITFRLMSREAGTTITRDERLPDQNVQRLITEMEQLEIPITYGRDKIRDALTEAGITAKGVDLQDAIRERKNRASDNS